jgi:redox-sensitive bicupin YhaK (pirin superfamily)
MNPTYRSIWQRISGEETSDGDGVKLTRILGSSQLNMLDPFLLLDCFESDVAQDYIGGFPTHPHRGFETVTYLLNGKMRHKDNAGHEGVIEPGGVQWMTAAKGILHSEMPEQEDGLLKGFQLWVNLPASAKMSEPAYQEFSKNEIPVERHDNGTEVVVIAGKTDKGTTGAVDNQYTDPIYMDITLPENTSFSQSLPNNYNGIIYSISGDIELQTSVDTDTPETSREDNTIKERSLGVLTLGEKLHIHSTAGARCLLIAGKPLNEPVARGGPFVMNTEQEIMQAFADFRNGKFHN